MARLINPTVWTKLNSIAWFCAIVTYMTWTLFSGESMFSWRNLALSYLISTFRGYYYVVGLYFGFKDRRKYFHEIHTDMEKNRSFSSHVFWCCIRTSFQGLLINSLAYCLHLHLFGVRDQFPVNDKNESNITVVSVISSIVLFVLQFFFWEVCFDFGHYWSHRSAHYFKWLWNLGHKVHHESISCDAWDGFNITLDDIFLTNLIPHMSSMYLMKFVFFGRQFSMFEWHLIESYKAFVEVTGHVGVDFKGHSFPLFPPLAYYLGCDIGTAAFHSMHHVYYNCNYAKRFALWDTVFGTIKRPPVLKKGSKKEMRKVFLSKSL